MNGLKLTVIPTLRKLYLFGNYIEEYKEILNKKEEI